MVTELIGPTALDRDSVWESWSGVSGGVTSQPHETIGPFQVSVMEEKVKLCNLKDVDSAGSLHQKYQELLKAMQGKDELIGQLEAQLEKQVRATQQQSATRPCPLQHLHPWAPLLEKSPFA